MSFAPRPMKTDLKRTVSRRVVRRTPATAPWIAAVAGGVHQRPPRPEQVRQQQHQQEEPMRSTTMTQKTGTGSPAPVTPPNPDDLSTWADTGGDLSLWPPTWNQERTGGVRGATNADFVPVRLRGIKMTTKATAAKTATTTQTTATTAARKPAGRAYKVPKGYAVKWPHGGHDLIGRTTAKEGPAWFVACNEHGDLKAAATAKEAESLGALAQRSKWCQGDHAKAATKKAPTKTTTWKAAPAKK